MRFLALALVMAMAAPAAAQDAAEPATTAGQRTDTSAQDRAAPASDAPDASDRDAADATAGAAEENEASSPDGASVADEVAEDEAAADEDPDEASDEESDGEAGEASDEEPEGPPPPHWTDERVGAWAGFGASFGLALLGGILLAVGIDDVNTIENAPGGTVWADVAGARDRAPILTGIGAVTLGIGAAGMAVTAALLAYFGQSGTWLQVSVLPTGLAVRGRF